MATPLTKNQKDNYNLKEKAAEFTAAFLIGRAEGLRVGFYATRSSEESCEALALRKGGAKCTCVSIITQMLYIFYAMLWYHINMAKTSPENISVINRRNYATELRVRGYTYRKISDELHRAAAAGEKEYNIWAGYNERDAWRDVRAELDNTIKETRETTEEFITLELQRLDLVTKAVYEILEDEDASPKIRLAAMDRLLKSQERRAKLLGLDMPTTVKTIDWRSEIIALVMAGQITIEQVRKELPEFADEIVRGIPQHGRNDAIEVREIEAGSWAIPDEALAEEPSSRS